MTIKDYSLNELLNQCSLDSLALDDEDRKWLDGQVKATPIDFEFAFALEGTLSEWSSRNDEKAYGGLRVIEVDGGAFSPVDELEDTDHAKGLFDANRRDY